MNQLKKEVNEIYSEITRLEKILAEKENKLNKNKENHIKPESLTSNYNKAYNLVKLSRDQKRPTALTLCKDIFEDFTELHGDRLYRDDPSMIGGIGILRDIPVTVVGTQKGRDVENNLARNFGMAHPEGYRKSLRLAKEAEMFGRPVITFIDTPGAYPGIEAEQRGQSGAIAKNLYEFSGIKTPTISVITGEGGSGGALALGLTDRIYMLSNSTYSVISPEGCATILWKDASKANSAARHLKLSAQDLYASGIIDGIIEEPDFTNRTQYNQFIKSLESILYEKCLSLKNKSCTTLLTERYDKFRKIGSY